MYSVQLSQTKIFSVSDISTAAAGASSAGVSAAGAHAAKPRAAAVPPIPAIAVLLVSCLRLCIFTSSAIIGSAGSELGSFI